MAACSANAHTPHRATDRATHVSLWRSTACRIGPSRSNTWTTAFAKQVFPTFGKPLMRRRSHLHAPSKHISRAGLPYSSFPRSTSGGSELDNFNFVLTFGIIETTASADLGSTAITAPPCPPPTFSASARGFFCRESLDAKNSCAVELSP